jgi:hypothetical protein
LPDCGLPPRPSDGRLGGPSRKCTGVFSSRGIERKTHEDLAFRFLAGNQHPDSSTICAFRRVHLDAIAALFVQIVQISRRAGLAKLGHVSFDGSKVQANASKHKAMRARTTKSSARAGESRTARRPDRRATTAWWRRRSG